MINEQHKISIANNLNQFISDRVNFINNSTKFANIMILFILYLFKGHESTTGFINDLINYVLSGSILDNNMNLKVSVISFFGLIWFIIFMSNLFLNDRATIIRAESLYIANANSNDVELLTNSITRFKQLDSINILMCALIALSLVIVIFKMSILILFISDAIYIVIAMLFMTKQKTDESYIINKLKNKLVLNVAKAKSR